MNRAISLIALALLATTASAADRAPQTVAKLAAQEGSVLVNQGEQFVTAKPSQALAAGDRVMVMQGGSAKITFNDGCAMSLASASIVEIPATSTCAGAVASVESVGPSYAQAVGAPEEDRCDDEDKNNDDGCPAAYWTANNRGAGWIFGAWTLGIAAALMEDESFDGTPRVDTPVSP